MRIYVHNISFSRDSVADHRTLMYVPLSLLSVPIIAELNNGFFINLGSFRFSAVWPV